MKKRILSLLMALVMVLSVMTVAAMAKGVQTFADVKESDWFYDAVCYVTDNGLMNGTGSGFAPQQTTSRAMLWAIQHDISDGTAPEAPITREQLAAMLYRYAQRKGQVRAASYADLSGFADAASVSAYAEEALQWAVANGILTGMDSKLCPQGNATRAQVAQILYRLCETWNLLPADNTAAIASAIYFAENPEHTHVWTYTSNQNGTHTATCACGETKTEYCGFPKQTGTVTCPTCGFTTDHGVKNYEDLAKAIRDGWTEIFITGDIEVEAPIKITRDVVIHGVGHTVTLADTYSTAENVKRVFMNVNAALTLDHMLFDGKNEENGKLFVVDNGVADGVLTLQDVTFQNFKGTQIVHSEQAKSARFINVKIKDNTLIGIASSGSNIGRACLLWMQGTVTEMDNVESTGNVVNTGANDDAGSGILIYQRNGGSNFSARKLTVENNKATNHVFANYSATAKNQYIFESGSIKNNTGNFFVAGSMTFGEEMTVESDIVFNNDSAGGVCTLTNNGLIVGDIQARWTDKRGEPIYTGTGTHIGTKTNIQDQTVNP